MIDWATAEKILQPVSFLDDLMNAYKYSIPDLPPFGEGKSKDKLYLENRLENDFEMVSAVLSACRSDGADVLIRRSAANPEISYWETLGRFQETTNVRPCGSNIPPRRTTNVVQPCYTHLAQSYRVNLIRLYSLPLSLPSSSSI